MKKRNLFLWSLYDFANSVLNINLLLYFSQWIIVDNKLPDIYYGGIFAASTLLLLITSPIIGVYADRIKKKLPVLSMVTAFIGIAAIALGIITLRTQTFSMVLVALELYFVVIYFYQASFVLFNSLLPNLSLQKTFGTASGWGEFGNNMGLMMGALLTLPIISQWGRSAAFLPAGILFILLSLPFLFFFKEDPNLKSRDTALGLLTKRAIELLKSLPSQKNILLFLVGFYFVSDAVRTIILFFPVYFEEIWNLPDAKKALLTVLLTLAMMFGAILGGKLSDKVGRKKLLIISCIVMILFQLLLIPLSKLNLSSFGLLFILGLSWGSYFAVARALLLSIVPKLQVGEYFGLYNLFERFASVIAPLGWSVTVLILRPYGTGISYRGAMFMTALLMMVGLWFFTLVKEQKPYV